MKKKFLIIFIYGFVMGLCQFPVWVYVLNGLCIWAGYAYAEYRAYRNLARCWRR